MLPVEFPRGGKRSPERADRELRALQRAHRRIGERRDSLRVEVVVQDRGDDVVHAARAADQVKRMLQRFARQRVWSLEAGPPAA